MDADARAMYRQFADRAARLYRTRIVRNDGLSWSINIRASIGEPMSLLRTAPDADDFELLLGRLRPFTMAKELVHLGRVHNTLFHDLTDSALREDLALVRGRWKAGKRGQIALNVNSESLPPERVLDLYLNGIYFHDDVAKADALRQLPPVMHVFTETVLQDLVIAAVEVVGNTNWIIQKAGYGQ